MALERYCTFVHPCGSEPYAEIRCVVGRRVVQMTDERIHRFKEIRRMASQTGFINGLDDRCVLGGHSFAVEVGDVTTGEVEVMAEDSEIRGEVEVARVVVTADGTRVSKS